MSVHFSGKIGSIRGVKILSNAIKSVLSYINAESSSKVKLENGGRVLREKQN